MRCIDCKTEVNFYNSESVICPECRTVYNAEYLQQMKSLEKPMPLKETIEKELLRFLEPLIQRIIHILEEGKKDEINSL